MNVKAQTRKVKVGNIEIGGGSPISVQTMTTANPHDAEALIAQVSRCARVGADIVRLTVPDVEAAKVLGRVRKAVSVPLVADIHFDWRCAMASIEEGVDALRLNPGNIGGAANVRAVAVAAKERRIPIRVGVNGGSLEKDILAKHGGATAAALVESAMRHVKLLEDEGFFDIVISVKASDVARTLEAYRLLSKETDCPLHLGVTEAGTFIPGTVRSSVALGILLSEGIGDTIRVSLTDAPEKEVRVGLEILRSLGLKAPGAAVTSCPTCGRTKADVFGVAEAVETALEEFYLANPSAPRPHIAVMGCVVNGPGEARGADIALCGATGEFLIYEKGELRGRIQQEKAAEEILHRVGSWE